MKSFFFLTWASALSLSVGGALGGSSGSPNILFILMDDMGFADLSARDGEFFTPNLDELYHDSVVLRSHYIGISVCSPSRAQILTGRYAWNMGLSDLSNFQTSSIAAMPAGVPTVAALLRQHAGYKTYITGKWHAGYSAEEHTPLRRGFDEFYGFLTSGIDYLDKTMAEPIYDGSYIDWWANDRFDFETQRVFSTQATGNRIEGIIEKHARAEEESPFYVYATFQAPHEQLMYVSSEYESNCQGLKSEGATSADEDGSGPDLDDTRYLYCLNIVKMDEVLGSIVDKLKKTQLWEDTLIVFTSDNGGAYARGSCNYPLSGGKGSFFEGGVRTLAFVGGGHVSEDQRGSERQGLMHGSDWTPTLLSIAGADVDHVRDHLQAHVYEPISKTLSVKYHDTEDHSQDYLMKASFDGMDLSQWLLFGNEDFNTRTSVPLSINEIEQKQSEEDDEEGDSEARRLIAADEDGNDIAILFTSETTHNVYKLIYSPTSSKIEMQSCAMDEDTGVSVELNAFFTSQLLFDLTLDSGESTNLMDNIVGKKTKSKKQKNSGNEEEEEESRRLVAYERVEDMEHYTGNSELAMNLWNEGMRLVTKYRNNVLFTDYLSCSEKTFFSSGDPSQFETPGWQPFFTWNQYVKKFDSLCADDASDVLYQLYTTTYDEFVEAASSQSSFQMETNDKSSSSSTSVNTHLFGNGSNHVLMSVGIVLAISLVILGYCLFYFVKRQRNNKYQRYTAIGP